MNDITALELCYIIGESVSLSPDEYADAFYYFAGALYVLGYSGAVTQDDISDIMFLSSWYEKSNYFSLSTRKQTTCGGKNHYMAPTKLVLEDDDYINITFGVLTYIQMQGE